MKKTKSIQLILSFVLVFAYTASSSQLLTSEASTLQTTSKKSFVIGIKGGLTDAWQDYGAVELPPNAETHIEGYHFALEVYSPINKYLSFGIEPGFVKRGAACIPGWNGGINPWFNGDTKFLINYIEVPIAVSAKLPIFKSNFALFTKLAYGPSYILKADQEVTSLMGWRTEISSIDLGENSILNRWDHGVYLGGGLSYQLKSHQLFFEYDYYVGLRDAERFNTSKNRDIDMSLGYRFTIN
jgi:hypothetical protein